MTAFRVQAKRTTASGPPAELEFGEVAYSDADQQFYVGRANPALPPSTFGATEAPLATVAFSGDYSDLNDAPPDYGPAIAALTSSDAAQGTAIDGLAADIALLDSSQTTQDLAIAAIEADEDAQNAAIATLATTTGDQAQAIAALNTSQTAQNTAIATLQTRPLTYGFTYDQQTEPTTPAAGATWRERSAGGLILGEWEWSGSLWLSVSEYDSGGVPEFGNIANSTIFRAALPFNCLLKRAVLRVGRPSTYNSNSYYNFQVRGVGPSTTISIGSSFAANTTQILATPSGTTFEVGINLESVFNPLVGGNTPLFVWTETSTFGSPSQLVRGAAVYSYRKIR
ncbi:hypothetical protein IQ265_00775 [Nodosilinea sp. LEGE 06152]|uniref:hypothetical protein n=1 Tax=Nodosilinea sp. LEGE 06152 TaxID=2777966 RepID=UPI00187EB423|nr:hypothetical protein [Nodosilinea sp. LEGE 06152]MBE9155381.1 hypothetical protein [Nodosilinea sp. LEGE 06152]